MAHATEHAVEPEARDAMVPRLFRLVDRRQDTGDTFTLFLEPMDGDPLHFTPGQFTMLSVFGVGEVPISVSGAPDRPDVLQHTVRDVGGVTHALAKASVGDLLGVRGPYGTGWDVTDGEGGDVVIVAGGIGLAPLRPAILQVLAERERYGRAVLLYGTRSPDDLLFTDELADWRHRGLDVNVTVDYGSPAWSGRVGLVTALVPRADFHPRLTLALICGPEVMMRYAATALFNRGLRRDRLRVSLERNMRCGVGLCGHCQLREFLVCVDGPVFDYPRVADVLSIREV